MANIAESKNIACKKMMIVIVIVIMSNFMVLEKELKHEAKSVMQPF